MSSNDKDAQNVREVKVFSTSIDTDTLIGTVAMQPSLYMAVFSMAMMGLSQKFPSEFLPPNLLHKKYNGMRMVRMTAVPFCAASVLYLAAASGCSSPQPLGGHLGGFITSVSLAVGFIAARKVSWYYPLIGMVYFTFGSMHHYRRMKLLGSNAPVYQWGDATAIWRHWRARKAEGRNKLAQRKALVSNSSSSQ